ncbi:hypothetical protein ASE75_09170 [Sphingomonas sp. Leaf17]|uniref:sensor histidine kinase n=1 Tax=Sphingomonas sp. Leaf17 TaxID=1735683 RepID=UPI0006FE82AE|nr:HAMP domain-containing sensor histidine kinase [Sphingomonas sp. Leaf17]KQM64165.1 hypothetical protein ASE75_09170 [Sphingomonas sp. Leaf17]
MRRLPRSLYGRMLGLSAIAIAVALLIAAFAIGHVLERFVTQGLDQRLDAELALLGSAVTPDGRIDTARIAATRALATPGYGWRIESPGRTIASTDAPPAMLPTPGRRGEHHPGPETGRDDRPDMAGPPPGPDRPDGPAAFDWNDRDGTRLHARQAIVPTDAGPVTITAAAPRSVVASPIRGAMVPLLLSLAVLGVALALATLVQLRIGLAPLATLRAAIAAVRAGRVDRVPADQPRELQPLVTEMNALLADNAAALAVARSSAANLAHGLKTPLATLGLALAEPGRDADGRLAELAAQLDATIRHHLGRARSVLASGRVATPLAPAITDLTAMLGRLHADRAIDLVQTIADDLAVAVDAHDLDEIAGNLLDNAFRHTRDRVWIEAKREGAQVVLCVTDNGPGIAAGDRARATTPGLRLDERGDGHGFGLAIVRDLAVLYGGALDLDAASGGGLVAAVRLPRAADV